jgi:hypothetical protein
MPFQGGLELGRIAGQPLRPDFERGSTIRRKGHLEDSGPRGQAIEQTSLQLTFHLQPVDIHLLLLLLLAVENGPEPVQLGGGLEDGLAIGLQLLAVALGPPPHDNQSSSPPMVLALYTENQLSSFLTLPMYTIIRFSLTTSLEVAGFSLHWVFGTAKM